MVCEVGVSYRAAPDAVRHARAGRVQPHLGDTT
jgi:hypothetical protein